MAITKEKIQQALDAGYTPEDIISHVKDDPQVSAALSHDYTPEDIVSHFVATPTETPAISTNSETGRTRLGTPSTWMENSVRPTLEGLGAVGGGAVGSGVGPAGTVVGAGLGYAAGKRLADIYEGVTPEKIEDIPGSVARDVGTGAAMEMGGQLIGPIAKALIPEQAYPKALSLLEKAGVKMSPGQVAGGWAKKLEDKLSGYPVLGDAITSARNVAKKTFDIGAGKRAGYQGSEAGHEMVAEIGDRLGQQYDSLLSKSSADLKDPDFLTGVAGVKDMVYSLPDKEQKAFSAIVSREISPRMTDEGLAGGESLQAMKNGLDQQISHFSASTDGYQRQLAQALKEVRAQLMSTIEKQNPNIADDYKQLNEAYANYKRIEGAAGKVGATNGEFTPSQLLNAVRAGDKSLNKKQFARGNALMQDYAEAGKNVLDSRVGSSGTSERLQATNPLAWAAGSAMAPLYNNALTRSLAKAPEATLNMLGTYAPAEVRRMVTPYFFNAFGGQ